MIYPHTKAHLLLLKSAGSYPVVGQTSHSQEDHWIGWEFFGPGSWHPLRRSTTGGH